MNKQLNISIFFIILVLLLPSQAPASEVDESSSRSKCSEFSRKLLATIAEQQNEGENCDVAIVVGEKEFKLHKVVISALSPYFRGIFRREMREVTGQSSEPITLPLDAGAFNMIKDYMYTGQITVCDSNVEAMLAAASYLQMKDIEAYCCNHLKENLDASNCLRTKNIADKYSCADLLQSAEVLALGAFEEVALSDGFLELTSEQLIDIISDDKLNADEEEVYEAVMNWIGHKDSSDADRTVHLPDILQHVRFSQMKSPYLVRVSSDPLIKACKQCGRYVKEAKDYLLEQHISAEPDVDESSLETRFKARKRKKEYLFAVGGYIDSTYDITSSVERYDLQTDQWMEVAAMKTPRAYLGVAALNRILYAVGGFHDTDCLKNIECYDPHTNKWTPKVNGPKVSAVAVLNGILYFVGEEDGKVVKYDPNMNEWIECKPLRQEKTDFAVAALAGCIYVLGGYGGDEFLNTVERYDPTQDEWYDVSPMIIKRVHFGITAHGDYLYAVGGARSREERELNRAERYDSRTKQWEEIAPMNEPRYGHGLAVADGLIYAAGGVTDFDITNTVEVYDPETNTWSGRAPMLNARRNFGLAVMRF